MLKGHVDYYYKCFLKVMSRYIFRYYTDLKFATIPILYLKKLLCFKIYPRFFEPVIWVKDVRSSKPSVQPI